MPLMASNHYLIIVIAYLTGALVTHSLLFEAMKDLIMSKSKDETQGDYEIDLYGWSFAINLLSIFWPITIVISTVGTIFIVLKSLFTSAK